MPTGLDDVTRFRDRNRDTLLLSDTTTSPEIINEDKTDNIADTINAILESKDALLENPWLSIDDPQTPIIPDPHSDTLGDIKTNSKELVIGNIPDLRGLPNFNPMMYQRNSISDSVFEKKRAPSKAAERGEISPSSTSPISYEQSCQFSDGRSLADSESAPPTTLTSSGITSNLRRLFSYKGKPGQITGPGPNTRMISLIFLNAFPPN